MVPDTVHDCCPVIWQGLQITQQPAIYAGISTNLENKRLLAGALTAREPQSRRQSSCPTRSDFHAKPQISAHHLHLNNPTLKENKILPPNVQTFLFLFSALQMGMKSHFTAFGTLGKALSLEPVSMLSNSLTD